MSYEELKYRQGWTLEQKIDHTVCAVSTFIERTNGKIYLSYSGGKDSLCILDIIRRFVDKNVPAVFCNTGNEYPEVVKFVQQTKNLTVIRPDIRVRQIIDKYGFPEDPPYHMGKRIFPEGRHINHHLKFIEAHIWSDAVLDKYRQRTN